MDRKGALWGHVYPIILLVIDPCCNPLRTGLLLHPYGWLTRQLQLAAQVPYASFRNLHIAKTESRGTHALGDLERLTAPNSRSSALWGGLKVGKQPISKTNVSVQRAFAAGVGENWRAGPFGACTPE